MKHIHHIVPRHAGGTDDPSNLIELTIEEHAEAHRLLYEEYRRPEDKLAWQALSGMLSKEDIIKELCSIAGKKGGAIGGRKGKGRKQTPEWIEKKKAYGEKNGMYGKPHSKEHKEKLSAKVKERIDKDKHNWVGSNNLRDSTKKRMENGTHVSQIIWTCEHCNTSGKGWGNYRRYHDVNCKEYKQPVSSNSCQQ